MATASSVSRKPPSSRGPSSPSTPLPSRHTPPFLPNTPKPPLYTRSANESTFEGGGGRRGKKDLPCLQIWTEETYQPRKMEDPWESSKEKHRIYPQLLGVTTLKTQSENSPRVPRTHD